MMMRTFVAVVHKDQDSDFGVSFPDFPGCVSAGETVDAAFAGAREALELHIEGMLEDGLALPEPGSTVDRVLADPDFADGVVGFVSIEPPSLRVNLSIDESLLGRIDRAAVQRGLSRSAAIAKAARAWMKDAS